MACRSTGVCLAWTLFSIAACGHSGGLERDYTPATHELARPRGQSGAAQAELLHVRYGSEHAHLRVRLINRGETTLRVPRAGILLHYGELELPLDLGQPAPEATTEVPPGEHADLEFSFHMGRPMGDVARLIARGLETEGSELPALTLTVPPRPALENDRQSSRR